MSNWDVIILAIYLTCVVYVFYQAIDSLEDQVTIQLARQILQDQLAQNKLTDLVQINFALKPFYGFDPLQDLSIMVQNLAEEAPLYVDWDRSTLSDFKGRSRRVIRIPAGMPLDLFPAQVFSVIGPGQTLNERITAEDTFQRNSASQVIEQARPLIDLSAARNLPEDQQLIFVLRLVLLYQLPNRSPLEPLQSYLIQCPFVVQRISRLRQVPLVQFLQQLWSPISRIRSQVSQGIPVLIGLLLAIVLIGLLLN